MLEMSGKEITIPNRLRRRVRFNVQCELTTNEILSINGALHALDLALKDCPCMHPDMQLNVFVVDKNYTQIVSNNPGTVGLQLDCAILYAHRWRNVQFDQMMIIATILEEFCHYFWMIKDEIIVLDKVRDLLHYLLPDEPEIDLRIQRMKEVRQQGYPIHN